MVLGMIEFSRLDNAQASLWDDARVGHIVVNCSSRVSMHGFNREHTARWRIARTHTSVGIIALLLVIYSPSVDEDVHHSQTRVQGRVIHGYTPRHSAIGARLYGDNARLTSKLSTSTRLRLRASRIACHPERATTPLHRPNDDHLRALGLRNAGSRRRKRSSGRKHAERKH
jgi:hypothetical protein